MFDYTHPPRLRRSCRHRWCFVCWARDPVLCRPHHGAVRHLIERCSRCGGARITLWQGERRLTGATYARSLAEALLGAPLGAVRLPLVVGN